ncbi:hypothetical protein C453_09608 [Haloferax elongans ATCC BAA-1513]|uniref:Uncharacterized protein n=1 Tax=Haloferax elongans ATCC BAA-1513 TaxID=1230453 RepID=M0HQQ2_HALEO|nr:hypothetical protein C453_09608 [Haloferax elongans ATCC BAA-1513]
MWNVSSRMSGTNSTATSNTRNSVASSLDGVGVWATATFFDSVVRAPEAIVVITTLIAAGATPAVTWYVLSKNGV